MSKTREKILCAVYIVLGALLLCEKLTGGILHAVLGMLLVVITAVHIGVHWKKFGYRTRKIKLLDGILMGAFAVMTVTGILMHPLGSYLAVKILHKLSAVLFLLCIIGHVIQHKDSPSGKGKRSVS